MRLLHFVSAELSLTSLILLAGCGGGSSTSLTPAPPRIELIPACANPAPIVGVTDPRVRNYTILFRPLISGQAQARVLATKYSFRTIGGASSNGFTAELDPAQVAALRCEPSIDQMAYGGPLPGQLNRN